MRSALELLLATAQATVPAPAGAVWLLDRAADTLTLTASRGVPEGLLPLQVVFSESIEDQQAIADGVSHCERAAAPFPTRLHLRLGLASRPLGILHLYAPAAAAFSAEHIGRGQALVELAAAFLAAEHRAAELAQFEASQAEFIHVTTHELRSPIAVSQTLVRNVVKGYAGALTEKQQYVFSRISAQLDHLEGLVNDLLDLAASRSRTARAPAPVALNGPVGRAALLLQPRAEEKGVALSYHACRDEIVVLATEDGLDRILVNLVGNAVKYTPAGGQVTVGLCQTGAEVFVTVADTGIGIPPEALPHLFDEFYRAPNARAANIIGTGLGLAIVKQLVELYHGTISVESAVGAGTTITVIFPAYHPDR
jgi:signal transduction histidine kinase